MTALPTSTPNRTNFTTKRKSQSPLPTATPIDTDPAFLTATVITNTTVAFGSVTSSTDL